MKILYGITKSNFGGAQRYVFDLARAAQERGHDVSVLCGGDGLLAPKLKAENINVITLDKLERDISITKEISSFFQIMKLYWKLTARSFKLKAVFTSHGWAFNEPRPGWQKILIKFFTWITILCAHKTICVSEKTKKDVERWPFVKNKLVVIYNGISKFDLAEREDKSFIVGTIAELHRIKGLDILLTAWSKFIRKHPARLLIVGEGEESKNLENMAHNLGISGSVNFKGFVDNARSLLSSFDIFCMPSRSEAMPYTLLEAGLAELPVIATPVGGIPEIIESGINGVLVPPEDSEALFSTLILLAEDDALRKRLGTNLRASIQENFSFEKMLEQTFALCSVFDK